MPIELIETEKSTTTTLIAYYWDENMLEVYFRENNLVYRYFDVPEEIWFDF